MLPHALVFLTLGIVAGLPTLIGIAGVATHVSWLLLVIGLLLLIVHLIWGDHPPRT